ncbi:hypothetical protein D3C78_952880 [compost metagenome]
MSGRSALALKPSAVIRTLAGRLSASGCNSPVNRPCRYPLLSAVRFKVFSKSPSTLNASAHGVLPGAGNVSLPVACSGQLPVGCNRPDRSRLRSSRCRCTESICNPSAVQCAASCRSLSCSLPLSNRLPTCTSPNWMATGNFRSGRLIGPLLDSLPGANCRITCSAFSCSMHRVMRVRHKGDQANTGCLSSTRSPACCHIR